MTSTRNNSTVTMYIDPAMFGTDKNRARLQIDLVYLNLHVYNKIQTVIFGNCYTLEVKPMNKWYHFLTRKPSRVGYFLYHTLTNNADLTKKSDKPMVFAQEDRWESVAAFITKATVAMYRHYDEKEPA